MTHGSLFSGIGGFDLAAQWMGWENIFHCEMADFPNKILRYYWPKAISYGDITQTTFDVHRGHIDVLSGGFPCQPYSAAGKRKGTDDDRHLWPHMLRAIREIRPRWVVGENVFGLTTWNGGVVLEEVCAQLESEGYSVQPFIIPAAAVNAPHRRDRVWFVAHANGLRRREEHDVQQAKLHIEYGEDGIFADAESVRSNRASQHENCDRQGGEWWRRNADDPREIPQGGIASNASCQGAWQFSPTNCRRPNGRSDNTLQTGAATNTSVMQLQRSVIKPSLGVTWPSEVQSRQSIGSICNTWDEFPTVTPICGGDDGLPRELDGITFPKWRAESIKGYGNAIVPQVALQIFRAIEIFDTGGQHG
jgi:DNA (cytosine-5)-methyltransferase 1